MQDKVKKASNDMTIALQPRVAQAKRSLEASIQQMGLKPGREIYQDDDALYTALTDLDHLRDALAHIANSVEAHRARLLDLARSQKALADSISAPSEPVLTLLRKHLPPEHVDAQVALGAAETLASNAVSRFAIDMSTPMADLSRTFEESFVAKITPLKKRYITQKSEYLKYLRQAAQAEDPVRSDNLNSIAQSAIPGWRATSEMLMAEIQSLLSYTTSNLSEWALNVAQAEAETYSRSAKIFDGPARQAENAQNSSSA